MQDLADIHFADAKRIRVMLDNLSTHTAGALYETFPAEAHRLLQRLEFHYTPKHASLLNMGEIEIGVPHGRCLNRRISKRETLIAEITAWKRQRNAPGAQIKWMFTTDRARDKLARVYPCPGNES
jgi:DDE superfamily endonuclease